MIRCWYVGCLLSAYFFLWGAGQRVKAEPGSGPTPSSEPRPEESSSAQAQGALNCRYNRYIVLGARDGFDSALAAEVRKDLTAELGPRGFAVCTERSPEAEPSAEVWLAMAEPSRVSIQVDDLMTGKRVSRDVPLSRIPAGGKALAIAIAADELLRASWAELSLPRRDEPKQLPEGSGGRAEPEPAASSHVSSRRVVNARAAPGSRRERSPVSGHFLLGLISGYTRSPRSWNALSLELRGGARPFGWGWVEAGLAGFGTLEVDVAAGAVQARGVSAGLSLGGCTREGRRLVTCAGARGAAPWIQFRGLHPNAGTGSQKELTAFVLSAAGQLRLRVSRRFVALLELALGGAPLGARADDGAHALMGLEGFVFSTGLGLGFQP